MSPRVDLFVTEPPHNIRRKLRRSCSTYIVFSKQNMAEIIQLCEYILKLEAHVNIFCSSFLIAHWTDAIHKWMKPDSGSSDGSPTDQSKEARLLGCKKKSIVYIHDQSNIVQHPRKSSHHVNLTEHTICFWRLRLSSDEMLESVDYYTPFVSVTVFPLATNLASGISRLWFSETVFDVKKHVTACGRRSMVCPE